MVRRQSATTGHHARPDATQTVAQAIGHPGRMGPDQRSLPRIPQQGALPLQRRGHSRIRARGVGNRTGVSRDLRPSPRWVRTASKPLVLTRHQRSRPAHKNRRSHGLHRSGLGLPSSMGAGLELLTPLRLLFPRDISDFTRPTSGLPKIAVGALVPEGVKDQKHQIVPGQEPHLRH
jgi:hypothetical protein